MIAVIIIILEVIVLAIGLFLTYKWINHPNGHYEAWVCLCTLVTACLEMCRRYKIHFIKKEGIKFTPGELIKHSEKLRKKFQEELNKCRSEKCRKDVIIRHVNRVDSYPDTDNASKGISPWFRAGLLDTYYKGIMVALRSGALSECPNGYRFRNYKNNEQGDIRVYMIGKIPYEFIEEVNFDGDEYYNYPHIYCHFKNKGQPYEEIVFCEEIDMGHGNMYYREVATFEDVEKNSKNKDGKHFI